MVPDEVLKTHNAAVEHVARQVKEARRLGVPYKKLKKSPSHFVPDTHVKAKKAPAIDITSFNDILEINVEERTCTAQPGVTFHDLVRATLPYGLVPHTVPEHKGITIGGAVSGCSLESMSFRHGGFHDTCVEYEMVSGEGDVRTCSRESSPELFDMVHGAYGTLAVLTKLKFRLHLARPFVRMDYRLFSRFDEYWEFLQERCEAQEDDFIDGIVHGPDRCVACIGNMVDSAPYTNQYDWLKVYYKSTLKLRQDYLTTTDYFFRYDADLHWLTRTVPLLEHWLPRLVVGKAVLGSTNVIRLTRNFLPLFRIGKRRPDLVVDVFIPHLRFGEFFDWYAKSFDYWPLWIVPYRAPNLYPWLADEHTQRMGSPFLIDCAVYGMGNNEPDRDYSELLEKKVFELGGIKTLISRNHYDRETFWSIYSKPRHDAARKRLDPDGVFGDFYEKMNPLTAGR